MNIKENPFFLLNATLQNNKSELAELEEEFSLFEDIDRDLLSEVTSPRLRVHSEMGWLLSVTDFDAIQSIVSKPLVELNELRHLHPLDQLNLISSALISYSEGNIEPIKKSILRLAELFEDLHLRLDEVVVLLNQERRRSGFPLISEAEQLEQSLETRKEYFNRAIRDSLDKLESKILVTVVTDIVDTSTLNGEKKCHSLVQDLVDYYVLESHHALTEGTANIEALIDKITRTTNGEYSSTYLNQLVSELTVKLRAWDEIAQPIQVSFLGKGLEHEESKDLAYKVRTLSLYMFNEKLEDAITKRLSEVCLELFGEVTSVLERVEQDIDDIEDIERERQQRADDEARDRREREREMAYSAEIGVAFKDRLSITASGVNWKGGFISFKDITFYRYQVIRRNLTTDYIFEYGSDRHTYRITTKKQEHFNALLDRLWKGIGYRLMINFAVDVVSKVTNNFSGIGVRNNGLVLKRKKFLQSGEPVLVPWNRLSVNTYNGECTISLIGDKKVNMVLPVNTTNYHVFTTLLSIMIEKKASSLSEVFGI